jgi:glycosyltransferase involved in cell wall biosynthesis
MGLGPRTRWRTDAAKSASACRTGDVFSEAALSWSGDHEARQRDGTADGIHASASVARIAWRPRSVLFVSWRDLANPMAGGSELLVHQLASGLAEKGYEVSLLCGGPVEAKSLYRIANSGGQYSQFLRAPLHYLRSFRSADLVVEVCNGMPFLVPLWRRGPNLCLVNHVHTELWTSRFGPLAAAFGRTMESEVMPRVHRRNLIVTVSESSKSSLLGIGIPEERIRMIPQGVAEPPAIGEKSRSPHFVAVGRLVGYKRIDLLLEMWESVKEQTGGTLTIIGDGPDREKLESKKVADVEFTGFVSEAEKHRLMSEAWLLLHPASWEGWGLVITEASVRGTPAVGFDVPGVRDALVDCETGLLAADPESFKKHWIRLVQDKVLYQELREAGMKRSLSYPVTATVNEFERIASEAVLRRYSQSPTGRYRARLYEPSSLWGETSAVSE